MSQLKVREDCIAAVEALPLGPAWGEMRKHLPFERYWHHRDDGRLLFISAMGPPGVGWLKVECSGCTIMTSQRRLADAVLVATDWAAGDGR